MSAIDNGRDRAEGKINIAIQRLAEKYPFHASILEQFQVLSRPSVVTIGVMAAADGVLLLYSPEFVNDLPLDQLTGVLLHEVHHVLFRHILVDPKDYPDEWARTVAEELTVNEFVKEPLPEGVITLELFPHLPSMESTDQRYRRLKQESNRLPIGGPNAGTNSGQIGNMIDDHSVWLDGTLDAKDVDEIILEVIDSAVSAVGTDKVPPELRRSAGIGSGDDQFGIQGLCSGQLDWRAILRQRVGQVLHVRPTFGRPPRRFPDLVGIVPGRRRRPDCQKILAVIDTSGSITPHLLESINAELVRLARDYPVLIVECDAAIKAVYSYRPVKKVTGGGGTDFRPVFDPDFLRRHHPDLIVYFTDGYGTAPERPPRPPVIWCITPHGQAPTDWGRVIQMENGKT
ncbi:MAG: hypothetical protein CMJ50_05565 [Planctomycetaceae bacterium]|jgi:predicted metal-dependent peptidase|nr:hypothetical protein [Planctomycetaceae bacterium]